MMETLTSASAAPAPTSSSRIRQGRGPAHRAGPRVRISAKGEYAIKAMVDLALHDGQDLRAHPGRRVPPGYPAALPRAGPAPAQALRVPLRATRVRGRLPADRPADQITVGALLRAVEGRRPGPIRRDAASAVRTRRACTSCGRRSRKRWRPWWTAPRSTICAGAPSIGGARRVRCARI